MNSSEQGTGSTRKLVMIVDDEPDMLSMLRLVIDKKCDCDVVTAPSGSAALKLLNDCRPEVIVSDIKMPDLDGLELLTRVREIDSTISVVIMTGYGTVPMAVQALKDGAYDFVQKPFDKDHIVRVVRNGVERTALVRTNIELQDRLSSLDTPEGFIGQSPPLKRVQELLSRVADTDATVLIRGESGTGKEVAARALHNMSGRKRRRMITVNCPALPENVLESELFGYSKGAFTGATHEKKGLFLEADGSTILLDEIADIPVSVQTKLLRVLQEKEIQPLGQNKTIKVDVRVVASTNQDLEAKIRAGEFREDLFYRLNVVTIVMPNLVEIREDIPLLIHHFLSLYKNRYNREELKVSSEVLQQLSQRKWQGNVRELKNSIQRLVLLASGDILQPVELEELLEQGKRGTPRLPSSPGSFSDLLHTPYNDAKAEILKRFSLRYLNNVLSLYNGNVTNAAGHCGLERQALQRLMRRYGVISADFKKNT
ncbi:sigma-54-dependent transcriptional regulator [Desulforhopalus singaporensis]|uniref:Response regulator receiver domain-containing protein n=1 Tax=Desulforhopalus singaporensis TaxID=91360 RepID=A0A1H0QE01_9BACT|nr:sigma-54 dependent transcriptional regulator [Desulforhopalus singaporensis]SDP14939.1 Response regulator receiver domain-containing protein [Desulforhopalus singaporensis]